MDIMTRGKKQKKTKKVKKDLQNEKKSLYSIYDDEGMQNLSINIYIIITVQMTIEKIKKVADQVILKGTNHKNEKCYYVYVGDKILDAIENISGMLEAVKLHINPD